MESTITEQDLDATSQAFVQSIKSAAVDIENDLDVDGLDESFMSRLLGLFLFRER